MPNNFSCLIPLGVAALVWSTAQAQMQGTYKGTAGVPLTITVYKNTEGKLVASVYGNFSASGNPNQETNCPSVGPYTSFPLGGTGLIKKLQAAIYYKNLASYANITVNFTKTGIATGTYSVAVPSLADYNQNPPPYMTQVCGVNGATFTAYLQN